MHVNIVTKTVTLNKLDMTGESWRGDIYGLKFKDVRTDTKKEIEQLAGYKVIYAHRNKKVLMIYNK